MEHFRKKMMFKLLPDSSFREKVKDLFRSRYSLRISIPYLSYDDRYTTSYRQDMIEIKKVWVKKWIRIYPSLIILNQ